MNIRQQAALTAATLLGPIAQATKEAIDAKKEFFAQRRAEREPAGYIVHAKPVTVTTADGFTVIRPSREMRRFAPEPVDVTAFQQPDF